MPAKIAVIGAVLENPEVSQESFNRILAEYKVKPRRGGFETDGRRGAQGCGGRAHGGILL